jgi:Glycosyltransferase family 92
MLQPLASHLTRMKFPVVIRRYIISMLIFVCRFMIVIDTDEIIVPRTASNYSELIAELDRQRNVPGTSAFTYVFLNIYFLLDFPPDASRPKYLRTMQYRHRVLPKSYGYAPKSIVDPRQCSVSFNHYCARYLERPVPRLKRTYRVPFAAASSHHYRRCGKFYAYSCERLFAEKTADDFILKYEQLVDARVTSVLRELGIPTLT